MKTLVLFGFLGLSLGMMSGGSSADFDWMSIDALIKKRQFVSAQEKVEVIYLAAKQEKKYIDWARAIQYKSNLIEYIEEDGLLRACIYLQEELKQCPVELEFIVQYQYAKKLYSYLNQNLWRIQERHLQSLDANIPLDQWDVRKIEWEILQTYQALMTSTQLNQKTEAYRDLIDLGKNSIFYFPDLYSFFGHEYYTYLKVATHYTPIAADIKLRFDEAWLVAPNAFVQHIDRTAAGDIVGLDYDRYSIHIIAQLLKHQMRFADQAALIYTESKRLELLQTLDTEGLHKPEILALAKDDVARYKKNMQTGLLQLQVIDLLKSEIDDLAQLRLKQKSLLEALIKDYKQTYAAQQAAYKLRDLTRGELGIEMESVYPKNQHPLVKVSYQNIKHVQWKLYRFNRDDLKKWHATQRINQEEFILKHGELLHSDQLTLPKAHDLVRHDLEFELPAFDQAENLVLLFDWENYYSSSKKVTYTPFHVTNLAYAIKEDKLKDHIQFYDRLSGLPIQDVKANLYVIRHERNQRLLNYTGALNLDKFKDNWFEINVSENRSLMMEIETPHDYFFGSTMLYFNRYHQYRREEYERVLLFTDRAIYRPGQKVYVQGLLNMVDVDQVPHIKPNSELTIQVRNPNNEVVTKLDVVADEHGAFNFDFVAGETGLNGRYTIASPGLHGQIQIRVEEYKRPSFFVEMQAYEGKSKINEVVELQGLTETYAGTPVSDAKVNYTVTRKVRFPYYYCWWLPFPSSAEKIIAVGDLRTDAKGGFNVQFTAEEGEPLKAWWSPMYHFEVDVKVTDINGETREDQTSIKIGSKPFYIRAQVPNLMSMKDITKLKFELVNAQGSNTQAEINLLVEQIKFDSRAKGIKRFWNATEFSNLTEQQYDTDFANYATAFTPDAWPVQNKIIDLTQNIDGVWEVELSNYLKQVGFYRIKVLDKNGTEVYKSYFSTYDEKGEAIYTTEDLFVKLDKSTYAVGETAKISIVSQFDEGQLQYWVVKKDKLVRYEMLAQKHNRIIEVPVLASDYGGFDVQIKLQVNNRYFMQNLRINVPWVHKNLNLEITHLDSIVEPGTDQYIEIELTDVDGKPVNGQLFARMYDASLDAFASLDWHPIKYPSYFSRFNLRNYPRALSSKNDASQGMPNELPKFKRSFPYLRYVALYARSSGGQITLRGSRRKTVNAYVDGVQIAETQPNHDMAMEAPATAEDADNLDLSTETAVVKKEEPKLRENLDELVFFQSAIDVINGKARIPYTMNDALTEWRLDIFTFDEQLASTVATTEVQTRKELMIFPQIPRFLREGDQASLAFKVQNMSAQTQDVEVQLEVRDALTDELVHKELGLIESSQKLKLEAGAAGQSSFSIDVAIGFLRPITIVAKAMTANLSDAIKLDLPIITNRVFMTNSQILFARAADDQIVNWEYFNELQKTNISPVNLELEMTTNPIWYAIQSMPYLMEDGGYKQTTDYVLERYYTNKLAQYLTLQYPNIEDVVKSWVAKNQLKSPLETKAKYKDLKLSETPWVQDNKRANQQMENLVELFNRAELDGNIEKSLSLLAFRQNPDGGFPWIAGAPSNMYTSLRVMEYFGKLAKSVDPEVLDEHRQLLNNLHQYLDRAFKKRHERTKSIKKTHLDFYSTKYLYARSFFLDEFPYANPKLVKQYLNKADTSWTSLSLIGQALLSVALNRNEMENLAQLIGASFQDNMRYKDALGAHLPYAKGYSYWYANPIATHMRVMEALNELTAPVKLLDEMNLWLLKNKQTNHWPNRSLTAEAIYNLLFVGSGNSLEDNDAVDLKFNDVQLLTPKQGWNQTYLLEDPIEGMNYGQADISSLYKSDDNTFELHNDGGQAVWGAAYVQYFRPIEDVTADAKSSIKIERTLYRIDLTKHGKTRTEVQSIDLKVGDQVEVVLRFESDRSMEFILIQDKREAGLEPIDVLSQFRYDAGFSYYMQTEDQTTSYFLDFMPQGKHELSYKLQVVNAGNYSGGLSTIASFYAPEFKANGVGGRLEILPQE